MAPSSMTGSGSLLSILVLFLGRFEFLLLNGWFAKMLGMPLIKEGCAIRLLAP